jgi:hypothetical protein
VKIQTKNLLKQEKNSRRWQKNKNNFNLGVPGIQLVKLILGIVVHILRFVDHKQL